jgi:hypothetical protein
MTRTISAVSTVVVAIALLAVPAAAQRNEFVSEWTSPTAKPLDFVGRKVAAVVVVDDLSLQMSSEEALAREITARGPDAIASYRIVPRADLRDKDKARTWFQQAGVEGLVVMRLLDTEKDKTYSAVVWSSGNYGNAWDYYGYGWATAYPIGKPRTETTITVETLLYDLSTGSPVWAGVTRTTDPKDTGSFMERLVKDVVGKLRDARLTR